MEREALRQHANGLARRARRVRTRACRLGADLTPLIDEMHRRAVELEIEAAVLLTLADEADTVIDLRAVVGDVHREHATTPIPA